MIPAEYSDALLEIITIGLQRARINPLIRQELISWGEVEKELIMESRNNSTEK